MRPNPHGDVPTQAPERNDRGCELAASLARRLTHEALAGLARAEIVVAPLKGILLLARWPELTGLRDLADVDLLVAPHDFQAATSALQKLGFEPTSRTFHGATFVREDWPLSIDLHHHAFGPHLFDLSTKGLLERATYDNRLFDSPVLRLSNVDMFAHILGHAVKSRSRIDDEAVSGDIAWLLDALATQPEVYAAHLRHTGMRRAAGYLLGADAFRSSPVAGEILLRLGLSVVDRAAIRVACTSPTAYWIPHLLNDGTTKGLRSFSAQAREDLSWRASRLLSRTERG